MTRSTAYVPAGELRTGDVMINAAGADFTVTKVKRIREGRKVFVERPTGVATSFTARYDALTRVSLPRPEDTGLTVKRATSIR